MNNFGRYVYILAIMLIAFPFQAFGISDFITPFRRTRVRADISHAVSEIQ